MLGFFYCLNQWPVLGQIWISRSHFDNMRDILLDIILNIVLVMFLNIVLVMLADAPLDCLKIALAFVISIFDF